MTERFAFPELKNNRAKGVRAGTLWIVKDGGGDVTLSLKFDALNSFEKREVLRECIGLLEAELEDLIKKDWENNQ
jgi:hypothetical protein